MTAPTDPFRGWWPLRLAEPVWGQGFAHPLFDDVFRIASMTKSFTASAVLLLRDRGLLRLDDEDPGNPMIYRLAADELEELPFELCTLAWFVANVYRDMS